MASCSERRLSPLLTKTGPVNCMAHHHGTKSPLQINRDMGRGKEEADWLGAPHFLLYLLHIAAVDRSSQQPWAQQANPGSKRALTTQPSASSGSVPFSPATERDGACWLPRGRTEGQSTVEPTPAWPRSSAAGPWPCSDSLGPSEDNKC